MRTLISLLVPFALVLTLGCSDDGDPKPDAPLGEDMSVDTAPASDLGPGPDTTQDAEVQSDLALDPDGRVILSNVPDPCEPVGIIHGNEGEADHLAAIRFTPPYYPFTVEAVRYRLLPPPEESNEETAKCDATIAHDILFFVTSEAALPPTPTVLWSTEIATGGIAAEARVIDQAIESPIELNDGETLILAVRMKRTADAISCFAGCTPVPANSGKDFWSFADTPPYQWNGISLTSYIAQAFGR